MLHPLNDRQRKRMHTVRDKVSTDMAVLQSRLGTLASRNELYGALVTKETMCVIDQLIAYDMAGHYTDLRYFEAVLSRAEYLASLFSRQLLN